MKNPKFKVGDTAMVVIADVMFPGDIAFLFKIYRITRDSGIDNKGYQWYNLGPFGRLMKESQLAKDPISKLERIIYGVPDEQK